MYEAVTQNDENYDGVFFYGVRSTGIFCRPSCPSRKPLRENTVFFANAEEAQAKGFRPCKRCRSDLFTYHPNAEIAEEMKEHLDRLYEQQRSWNDEAETLGLSTRRMVDIFKEEYGVTPKVYMDTLRLKEAERLLTETDAKVIDIASRVGFGGLSTFHRFFKEQTDMSPTEYRKKIRK